MNQNIDEIVLCAEDYIEHYDVKNIDEIVEYVYIIMIELYNKKYIYKEFLEQIISEYFLDYNKNYEFVNDKEKHAKTVMELLKKPQSEQRSEQWHHERKNSIGASELASVFNKNPFCSLNKLIIKKSGENDIKFESNKYCDHGIKYEYIAQLLYTEKNDCNIIEFGSLPHNNHSFIRASPDGITETGTMLEIKVPLCREIVGLPPIYYWYQMQQQLEVCDLNVCDFLECKIEEYINWNDFLTDNYNGNYNKTKDNMEKGIILEYIDNTKYKYLYPEKIATDYNCKKDWQTYIYESVKILKNRLNPKQIFSRVISWKLTKYSCISVYRNKNWWKNNLSQMSDCWNKILHYRNIGCQSLIKPKTIKKKKEPKNYNFIEDL